MSYQGNNSSSFVLFHARFYFFFLQLWFNVDLIWKIIGLWSYIFFLHVFQVRFITKIWHPNISSVTGAICLDILKDQWWVLIIKDNDRTCLLSSSLIMCFTRFCLFPQLLLYSLFPVPFSILSSSPPYCLHFLCTGLLLWLCEQFCSHYRLC